MNGHANDGWETVTAPGGKAAKKTGNGKAKKAKAAAFKGPRLEDVRKSAWFIVCYGLFLTLFFRI